MKVNSLNDKCRAGSFFLRQREVGGLDKVAYDEVQYWMMDRKAENKEYEIDEL